MTGGGRRGLTVAVAAAALFLAATSTVALAAANGAFRTGRSAPNGRCSAPALPGTVVDIHLADMGGRTMMGAAGGNMMGGTMRVMVNRSTVPAGTVSLRVANLGTMVHELIVLPLAPGSEVGHRPVGADGRIDETGSVGEASHDCGSGSGDGISPGGLSWITVRLVPGSYELLCNLPGHYAAGMYTELRVG